MRGRWAIEDQTAPWHFLYFLPLPHGQGSLRSTLATGGLGFGGWAAVAAGCVRRMASKAAEAGGRRVAMRAARSCCWALISSGLSLAAWRVNGELGSEVKPPCAAIPPAPSPENEAGGAPPPGRPACGPPAPSAPRGGGLACTRTRSDRLATSSSIATISFSNSLKPSALYSFFGSFWA